MKRIGGEIKLPKALDWKAVCQENRRLIFLSAEGGGMDDQVGQWIGIRLGRVLNVWLTILDFILWAFESRDHIKTLFQDA